MKRDKLAERLLGVFLTELDDQLRTMNAVLLALEANPTDSEQLKTLFRVAHTLKGAARAAGAPVIEEACHRLETFLAQARDGAIGLTPRHFDLLFGAADALADAGAHLRAGTQLEPSRLAALVESLASLPPESAQVETAFAASENIQRHERSNGLVRVPAEKLDTLLSSGGDLLVTSGRFVSRAAALDALLETVTRGATEWRHTSRSVRLALDRAGATPGPARALTRMDDHLLRTVQDVRHLSRAAREDARTVVRVAEDVLHHLRSVRMRPVSEAWEALPRVVRDLASTTGKEVDLELRGGDVEADRAVLDGLREALLQLVRNAVDHGIEPAGARAKTGKPRRGRITVAAARSGDRLVLTVSDDGTGLDIPAIRVSLERRGIAAPAADAEVGRLMLETNVSTREEVTTISGRGIGLDIVRTAVARIRGTAAVTWEAGRGTSFKLECPPTLATLRVLIVRVASQSLAIPTMHVERLLRVKPNEIKQAEGQSVLPTANGPVPLVALARLLPPLVERPDAGALLVVLLRVGERRLGAVVDEAVTEQELVVRPLDFSLDRPSQVSGAALLATGEIALVLDPARLLTVALGGDVDVGVTLGDASREAAAVPRILVVDDSLTTRTLEESVLQAAGYDVLTAVDGSDAWRLLQEHGCDLIVADVEMPRMDGFELCEAVRKSTRWKTLPVVLVTAMETPEHRARGLDAGADAYIGKSSLDQQYLLDTIRDLLG
jgi:two-component system chemotaxis sensor kinase CheA